MFPLDLEQPIVSTLVLGIVLVLEYSHHQVYLLVFTIMYLLEYVLSRETELSIIYLDIPAMTIIIISRSREMDVLV